MGVSWRYEIISKTRRTLANLILLSSICAVTAPSMAKTEAQTQYLEVRKLIKTTSMQHYQAKLAELVHYPLYPYLQFQYHARQLNKMSVAEYTQFLDKISYTPLVNTAKYRYLLNLGYQKRWQDFLTISPKEPKPAELKCFYYTAQLYAGDIAFAWRGTEKLWLTGRSQKKQCNFLFNRWQKSGKRTDYHIWQRMLLAFDIRRGHFVKYLSKELQSSDYKSYAKTLLSVYHNPKQLKKINFFVDTHTTSTEIIEHGLKRLARFNLEQGLQVFSAYQKRQIFTEKQNQALSKYFSQRILVTENKKLRPYLDSFLTHHPNDNMVERRLRWAISEQNWLDIEFWLQKLQAKTRDKDKWQYWQARVFESIGQVHDAEYIYEKIADKRSFYGFVGAYMVGESFSLNTQTILPEKETQQRLENHPAILRMQELFALNFKNEARYEWLYLLNNSSYNEKRQLALFAYQNNWPNLGIEATIHGKLWDALEVRFPSVWLNDFSIYAKKHQVSIHDLQAITRRESAYNLYAKSPVGARGPMQIMPRTARQTARKIGVPYKSRQQLHNKSLNLMLGSAYYQQLIKQFNNNRIFAIASYNAGPSRVKQWRRESDGTLDVMSFIETIPFTETREYVQAVLIYRVIYQIFNDSKPELFSLEEWQNRY